MHKMGRFMFPVAPMREFEESSMREFEVLGNHFHKAQDITLDKKAKCMYDVL